MKKEVAVILVLAFIFIIVLFFYEILSNERSSFEPFGIKTVAGEFSIKGQGSDIDSLAFWEAPNANGTLLFVTAKGNNLVEVWKSPFQGNEQTPLTFSTQANGVIVDQDEDILYVGLRVPTSMHVFSLPNLTETAIFANNGAVSNGETNNALLKHSNGDHWVYVTDNSNAYAFNTSTLELLHSFSPPVTSMETILADSYHQIIYVPEEQGIQGNVGIYAFTSEGLPFLKNGTNVFGSQGNIFQADEEGITLYTCSGGTGLDNGEGFIIVADQRSGATDFEFFDRKTWGHLGTLIVSGVGNTDGIASTQKPLPGFPSGIFAAVNNDVEVVLVSWENIINATGLVC